MDRTALAGIASISVALILLSTWPLSTRAESSAPAGPAPVANAPRIAHATESPSQFVFLAGPDRSDVAWSTGGDLLVATIELQDPAEQVSAGIASAMAKRKGGQVIEGIPTAGRADFTVTVKTTEWSAGYYVPSRPTYSVKYAATLTITDASGAVVKSAKCGVPPDDSTSAGGNALFLAHKGKLLKSTFDKAAKSCLGELIQKTKSV